MHTTSAAKTVDRVIEIFPANQQAQIRSTLADALKAVVSQTLFKRVDVKGRCAALEIMINTPHIAELILKGDIDDIKEAMTESGQYGMQTFDMALHELYKVGRIDLEEALNNADSRTNLEAKINFG